MLALLSMEPSMPKRLKGVLESEQEGILPRQLHELLTGSSTVALLSVPPGHRRCGDFCLCQGGNFKLEWLSGMRMYLQLMFLSRKGPRFQHPNFSFVSIFISVSFFRRTPSGFHEPMCNIVKCFLFMKHYIHHIYFWICPDNPPPQNKSTQNQVLTRLSECNYKNSS